MNLSTSTRSLRYIFTNKSHTIELEGHWLRVIGNYVCGYFVAGTMLWARVVTLLYGLYAIACAAVSILPRQAVTHSECGTVRSPRFTGPLSAQTAPRTTATAAQYAHHTWFGTTGGTAARQYTLLHSAVQCSAVQSVCRSIVAASFSFWHTAADRPDHSIGNNG